MPDQDEELMQVTSDAAAGELRVPVIQEQTHVSKQAVDIEHVTVRTGSVEEQVLVRDEVRREQVEVTRVAVDREVAEAPPIRTEGDVTILPVLEGPLVVEKRLFLVEELHVRRRTSFDPVEMPMTLRRTHVAIERTDLQQEEI